MRKVFVISVSRNDSDIIESFCRHALEFSSGIFICDNGSTDNTTEILRSLRREGLPVVLYAEHPAVPGDHEEAILNEMARTVIRERHADFILPAGVNQFLASRGGATIAQVIHSLRIDAECLVDSRVGIPNFNNAGNAFVPSECRRAAPAEWDAPGLAIIGGAMFESHELTIRDGFCRLKHNADANHRTRVEELLAVRFPVRSSAQFIIQSVLHWLDCHERWGLTEALTPREKLLKLEYEYVKSYGASLKEQLHPLAVAIAQAVFEMSEGRSAALQPLSAEDHSILTDVIIGGVPLRYADDSRQTAILSHLFPGMDRVMSHLTEKHADGRYRIPLRRKGVLSRFFSRMKRAVRGLQK